MDVVPTLLELAGVAPLAALDGRPVLRPEGRSFAPLLRGEPFTGHDVLYWEHGGGRVVRRGDFKLAALPGAEWELFDLSHDRTESHDVSRQHPRTVRELDALWSAWRERMTHAAEP